MSGSGKDIHRQKQEKSQWECLTCTYQNDDSRTRCEMCQQPQFSSDIPFTPASDVSHSPPLSRSSTPHASKPYTSHQESERTVYFQNLPTNIRDGAELENRLRRRLQTVCSLEPVNIKCYMSFDIGIILVAKGQDKEHLVQNVGSITLHTDGRDKILFVATLELVSYIVLEVKQYKGDDPLPTGKEVSRRWSELCKDERVCRCDQLNIQFPNIYRVTSGSLDQLLNIRQKPDFAISGQFAHVYICADCSFLEDLPRALSEDQLRHDIGASIKKSSLTVSSLYVQLNKQTGNACILATDTARSWSGESHLMIGGKSYSKKENLSCRLSIYPIPPSFFIQKIINHPAFAGKVTNHKQNGENLILELGDRHVFEERIKVGMLRIDDTLCLHVNIYNASSNPEGSEIDTDTWYETEMPKYKADIMQFVVKPKHEIFRYKWNSQIWLEQFKRTIPHDHENRNVRDRKETDTNKTRHQLRVTVMLNTIGVILKGSYKADDQHVNLNLDSQMKTIVYDHQSKLEQCEKMPTSVPPYSSTRVEVVNEDCLLVYEHLAKNGQRPLLLNMANATSPGGGYRKGDGAQEENLFRRSDYCRSLDVGLDDVHKQPSTRYHCSSNCKLDRLSDDGSMYPMNEFGAIYTSGLTVFRQPEDTGYAFMKKPLENVCSLAMAAYRDPKLDRNMLAGKYAVGMRKKIENIFAIAYHHRHQSLVLSAIGCGAFKNPPEHVVQLFRSVIEQYAGFFKLIIFAIIDDHNSGSHLNPEGNFKPFKEALDGSTLEPLSTMNKPNTMFGPYLLLSDGSSVGDVCICDLPPCQFGAKCNEMHDSKHSREYSHPPLCPYASVTGKCRKTKDVVHVTSLIHRQLCRCGGQCLQIDDGKHSQEFEHPIYCPDGGKCQNMKEKHLIEFRHLPLCGKAQKCIEYQKHIEPHCNAYRHCTPQCPYGNQCANFHDKQHMDEFAHPFPTPCPFTPFQCKFHDEFTDATDNRTCSSSVEQHCLAYAHVCRAGRNCENKNSLHLKKSIHIARHLCPKDGKCKQLTDENHLNSFTHSNVDDVRLPCKYDDRCHDRRQPDHITKFRHAITFEHSSILRYYNLNKEIDFVENQKNIIARVTDYVEKNNWKPLPSGSVPREILDWLRSVQPIHRCNPIIFESILLHGHVMSRDYMVNLKHSKFVANSVLQHGRIRRIGALREKLVEQRANEYIIALVEDIFEKEGFYTHLATVAGEEGAPATPVRVYPASCSEVIQTGETFLSRLLKENDLDAIRSNALAIARASMKLHMNPSGIGFSKDKDLETDKSVFSILGPNLGHYYGDVIIVFKREILHHPDANFCIQAATSFASGSVFTLRPWWGTDPGTLDERVKLYHQAILNASVPGYEYAAALELIAFTSLDLKLNSMDIDLDKIHKRWLHVDAHLTVEGHLPRLIPLSYIDHVYMPKNFYDSFSDDVRRAINANFKRNFTIISFDGDPNQPHGPHTPVPKSKSRADFQDSVVKELFKQYSEQRKYQPSRPVTGTAITIASSDFTNHYVLPLTIKQAYEQYRFQNKHRPRRNMTYIYWQVVNGDMMLTLCNEPIDPDKKQPDLRCLTCYVAGKPTDKNLPYHENYSYLNNHQPFKHLVLKETNKFAASSNTFYVGCNTDDLMTFCLEIDRSNGTVTLFHASSNGIYNHERISHTFSRGVLDLNQLNFIHVSAGSHSVPIRNLIICFEKQVDFHPTFDKDYREVSSSSPAQNKKNDNYARSPSPSPPKKDADDKKSGRLLDKMKRFFVGEVVTCPDNVNCLIQYSESNSVAHNKKYSHPCPYSELCREKESHLTHEPHKVPMCKFDKKCDKIVDPFHRAAYRHTDLPDFLKPCRDQNSCHDDSRKHRRKYSHGEKVYGTKAKEVVREKSSLRDRHDHNPKKAHCKWGSKCWDIGNRRHCKEFSHSAVDSEEDVPHEKDHRTPCIYGVHCRKMDNEHHRAKYSHVKDASPSDE
ncbi:unnamed protein product [Rotaria magnacalcarata]|uniref:RanBP2-type domain-containing protein n=1 Tax=Rotaria magnacalcarata TaxID=392030 RepID=A0A819H745_9BILA|nr:unnamed protein product [Rotaria magnacalcarata]CAF3896117.1 unnamed protein product [Rotaria magnacalcarata]